MKTSDESARNTETPDDDHMTGREQMIETVARALAGLASEDSELDWPAEAFMREAAVVLDAVLPQITTIEQLKALPGAWYLLGELDGRPYCFVRMGIETSMLARYLERFGPFTVVWRPD
jgi:hypothetical protein